MAKSIAQIYIHHCWTKVVTIWLTFGTYCGWHIAEDAVCIADAIVAFAFDCVLANLALLKYIRRSAVVDDDDVDVVVAGPSVSELLEWTGGLLRRFVPLTSALAVDVVVVVVAELLWIFALLIESFARLTDTAVIPMSCWTRTESPNDVDKKKMSEWFLKTKMMSSREIETCLLLIYAAKNATKSVNACVTLDDWWFSATIRSRSTGRKKKKRKTKELIKQWRIIKLMPASTVFLLDFVHS